MLADEVAFVIGGDTHLETHTLAIVEAQTIRVDAHCTIETDTAGYEQALGWADAHANGARVWALEGTGHFGAGFARFLAARGERVIEIDRPARVGERRRSGGKDDRVDAIRAAQIALGRATLAEPRSGGIREALRTLLCVREAAVGARRVALCQLKAQVVVVPDQLRARLRGRSGRQLVPRCLELELRPDDPPELRIATLVLRSLADRAYHLGAEARLLEREIRRYVDAVAPQLLDEPGVGPITAARVIVCWSHRGRFQRESRFARLAGAAPIPASSGQHIRRRLDRGGDRQLNRALHTIILARRIHHPPTRDYIARRTAEGKTTREAVRCLKRYLARRLYRLLEHAPLTA
jgi:transposase